jgi:hypothetical protein
MPEFVLAPGTGQSLLFGVYPMSMIPLRSRLGLAHFLSDTPGCPRYVFAFRLIRR